MNIPSGWKLKHIQDDFETFSGGTPNTKNDEYYKGTIPWIRSTEINQKIITETEKNISFQGLKNSSAKMVYPGYVLLALYGATAGEVAITNIEGAINQAVLAIKAKNNDSSNDYLYYYLSYHKDRIINKYVQGGQPNLSGGIIKNLLYLSPPRKEQQKIASILSTWDEAILLYEKLLLEKNKIKKGMHNYVFQTGGYFSDHEISYDIKKLEEIAYCYDTKRKPLNKKQREAMSGDIPYYGANGVVDYINDYIFNDTLILLAEDGGNFFDYTNRRIAYKISGKSWVNNHAHVLKNKDNVDFDYLYYSLEHKDIRKYVIGTTRTKLNQEDMLKIEVKIPEMSMQRAIKSVFLLIDHEIQLLEELIKNTKIQKRGLMQLLLTGKVRV